MIRKKSLSLQLPGMSKKMAEFAAICEFSHLFVSLMKTPSIRIALCRNTLSRGSQLATDH